MIYLFGSLILIVIIVITRLKSKKSLKLILAEVKYEVFYNIEGSKALLQDVTMKQDNKTDLPSKLGKVAVITGGTRGIGLEVIKMLLKCDITVIIGCRDTKQGQALLSNFRKQGITTGNTDVFKLDVSLMDSVVQFAAAVKQKYHRIHYLINNAGIMFGPYTETKDGHESQFSTNYLGHFLLTHSLLPQLKSAGEQNSMTRIVNVSSCAHMLGDINFEDINNREMYIPAQAYAQSKFAQVLFTKYLDNLLKKEKAYIQVHSVHPGIVNTDLFNGTHLKNIAPWLPALVFKTPEQGAIPIVHASLASELEGKGGTYIHNCKVFPTNEMANSVELQEQLFNFTNRLLKIENFGVINQEVHLLNSTQK